MDRTMADYVYMLRSGMIRHAIAYTMPPSDHRRAVLRIFGVLRECFADFIPRNNIQRLERESFEAICSLQNLFPDNVSTICTHLLTHLPRALHAFGPICNSWTMWGERMNRYVRNSSKEENRCIPALANGLTRRRNNASRAKESVDARSSKANIWKKAVVRQNHMERSTSVDCFVLSINERIQCLQALQTAGIQLPQLIQQTLRRYIQGGGGHRMDVDCLGSFECGHGIRLARSNELFKCRFAPKRPNERTRHYIVTKYGDAPQLYVASIEKIVGWKAHGADDTQYALKVINRQTVVRAVNGVTHACYLVDTKRVAAAGGGAGEFVAVDTAVSHRAPMMIPRSRPDGAGHYRNLYAALITNVEGEPDHV